jgi:hypothetical protein
MADPGPHEKGVSRRPKVLDYLGAGERDEETARAEAEELVRYARGSSGRFTEGPAPDPDAVRQRRESRQHSRNTSG